MLGWAGCPRCGGAGKYEELRDLHRSAGIVPCSNAPPDDLGLDDFGPDVLDYVEAAARRLVAFREARRDATGADLPEATWKVLVPEVVAVLGPGAPRPGASRLVDAAITLSVAWDLGASPYDANFRALLKVLSEERAKLDLPWGWRSDLIDLGPFAE